MKILAIDTASKVCSVSLLEEEQIIIEKTSEEEKTHSQRLMPMVAEMLEEAGVRLEQIKRIACDRGPRFFYWCKNWNCNSQSICRCIPNGSSWDICVRRTSL